MVAGSLGASMDFLLRWSKRIALVVCVLVVLSILSTWAFGRFAATRQGPPSSTIPAVAGMGEGTTTLDRMVNPLTDRHPGESGLKLIASNVDAFASRAMGAEVAERSLDLMYYIWDGDMTGRMLMATVLDAAERGVRVRILLDDVGFAGDDDALKALDSHPNIEVRIFNPTRARGNGLQRGIEMALRIFSVTRRMHNKAWIIDGQVAIIGGRNIGDIYFDAARDANYRDLDLLAVGPVVAETSAMFDAYWNNPVSLTVQDPATAVDTAALAALENSAGQAANMRDAAPYAAFVRDNTSLAQMSEMDLHWDEGARLVADPPEKALAEEGDNWLMREVAGLFAQAETSIEIASPYFVPGVIGTELLTGYAAEGVSVTVLTNSLAATDVAAVHGGYAPYRLPLLQGRVNLFELRPTASPDSLSFRGSNGASLHTKAFTVDDDLGFVGSLNFDPRSTSLNTEMGIIFENPDLVAEIRAVFAEEISPALSYRVVLRDGALAWEDHDLIHTRDPKASLWRRAFAWVVGILPLESQL